MRAAGLSNEAIVVLARGKTNMDELPLAIQRSADVRVTTGLRVDADAGEDFLRNNPPSGVMFEPGPVPLRAVDGEGDSISRIYDAADADLLNAREAKVGRCGPKRRVREQVRRDAALRSEGLVGEVQWHFFAGGPQNAICLDPSILGLLADNNIPYVLHLS